MNAPRHSSRSPRRRLTGRVFLAGVGLLVALACRPIPSVAATGGGAPRDTLVVVGRPAADPMQPTVTGVTTVLELESHRGGADLAEILATAAGLQLRRYGGLGAPALPSIRGSTAAQVRVFVDGLPVSDAQTGIVDLATLPLERFATAEIHRGLVPAGFGGVGATGAINLRTRTALVPGLETRVFAGSFGDLGGRASYAARNESGHLSGLVLVHGRQTNNDYTYTHPLQTYHQTGDDTLAVRTNADFAEGGWFLLGEAGGGAGTLRATAGGFRREGGRPGPLGQPSPHARLTSQRWDARMTAATRGRSLTLDVNAARRDESLDDPNGEVGWGMADVTTSRSGDLTARAAWSPVWPLEKAAPGLGTGDLGLTTGAEVRRQWYDETRDQDRDPRRERLSLSAFAGLALDLFGPRLRVEPSLRWQRLRDDFPPVPPLPWLPEEDGVVHVQEGFSPALGTVWQIRPEALFVEAHWQQSLRPPTWVELFGHLGGLVGNRDLVPEEITGWDAGLRWRHAPAGVTVRGVYFEQKADRTIIWRRNSQATSTAENIGRTESRGVELEAAWRWRRTEVTGNLTWQHARDRGLDPIYHGKELPYLPALETYLEAAWDHAGWRPGVRYRHQSANYRDRYNQELHRAPARSVWGLSLARTWSGGLWGRGHAAVLTLDIVNLADRAVYDVEGYPLPGRSTRLSLSWR